MDDAGLEVRHLWEDARHHPLDRGHSQRRRAQARQGVPRHAAKAPGGVHHRPRHRHRALSPEGAAAAVAPATAPSVGTAIPRRL